MTTQQVKDWMTSEVITVKSSCSLPEAYWLMIENKIRRLPVMDGDTLIGIVTLENLRRINPISVLAWIFSTSTRCLPSFRYAS
jgi:signal-transduction protein with cAMP-binding, CBS, and nucleotidyltransferase domain